MILQNSFPNSLPHSIEDSPQAFIRQFVRTHSFSSFEPSGILCVESSLPKEEVKKIIFKEMLDSNGKKEGQGLTIHSQTITDPLSLASKVVEISERKILLSPARREVLRMLLQVPGNFHRFPELLKLRRQRTFFQRLDRAFQAGRFIFSHEEEEAVFESRLEERFGKNKLRAELRILASAYEHWLEGSEQWDPIRVFRSAIEILESGKSTKGLLELQDKEILYLHTRKAGGLTGRFGGGFGGLEKSFWEALSRKCSCQEITLLPTQSPPLSAPVQYLRCHTFEDAAETLADQLVQEFSREQAFPTPVILIPDQPEIRRSLIRALESRNIPLYEYRDPTRLRLHEGLKQALLPLEIVSSQFERDAVSAWVPWILPPEHQASVLQEISNRGVRVGLKSYQGLPIEPFLKKLNESLGVRLSFSEFMRRYLEFLKQILVSEITQISEIPEIQEVLPKLEALGKEIQQDLELVGQRDKKAPAVYWFEKIKERIPEASPPLAPVQSKVGVRIFRTHQSLDLNLGDLENYTLYFFGLPSEELHTLSTTDEAHGDYWYNSREREFLSNEFAVRSHFQAQEEHSLHLQQWVLKSNTWSLWDAEYDWDGRERETLSSLLSEWGIKTEPTVLGAHFRWIRSYRLSSRAPSLNIQLPSDAEIGREPSMNATALDRMSRCEFQALVQARWKLYDLRSPDTELWPEVQGNLLHEAVKQLLLSRSENGVIQASVSEALSKAWKRVALKGWEQNARSREAIFKKCEQILNRFIEKENEYLNRAQTRTLSLENTSCEQEFAGVRVVGTPDRIEEHPEGWFVMDYKTSSAQPHGSEMLEKEYRLQLPFYALALAHQSQKKILGVQFIELTRKGGRGSGVFFKDYNGKEPGKLTQLRANVKSLMETSPEEVWSRFERAIQKCATRFVSGRFEVKPKKDAECRLCTAKDLCGIRRQGLSEVAAAPEAPETGDAGETP